jgi:hypothetical protein
MESTTEVIAEQPAPPAAATPPAPAGDVHHALPSTVTPPKKGLSRGGGKPGNVNALKSGLRSNPALKVYRLVTGRLVRRLRKGEAETEAQAKKRKALSKVESHTDDFRATIEEAVFATYGDISLSAACLIATAARWERHGLLGLTLVAGAPRRDGRCHKACLQP